MPESLRPDEPTDRPLTPLAGALWAVALTMLVMCAVEATDAARPTASGNSRCGNSTLLFNGSTGARIVRWTVVMRWILGGNSE